MEENKDEQTRKTCNIQAALEAGQRLGALGAGIINAADAAFVLVPSGYELKDVTEALEQLRPAPRRLEARPTFTDVRSFCAYVCHFVGSAESLIFASERKDTLIAALDYHAPGEPSWNTHRAALQLQVSPEWVQWTARSGQSMNQEQFLEWLQDHAGQILEPTAARLEDICENLDIRREVVFNSRVSLQNGTYRILYDEKETTGNGAITVPSRLSLALRRYAGQQPLPVSCRLRYKLPGGKLSFTILLDQIDAICEEQFAAVCAQVAAETGRPVLQGTP